MGFQKQVNQYPAPGVAGDFASSNPRASVVAGEGALVVDPTADLVVGRFAWADATGKVKNTGTGVPTGFVGRNQQGLITTFLAESTDTLPRGYGVTLFSAGDFWAKTDTVATVGQKVFAKLTDGTINTGAAGAVIAGYIETKFVVVAPAAIGELIKMGTWA